LTESFINSPRFYLAHALHYNLPGGFLSPAPSVYICTSDSLLNFISYYFCLKFIHLAFIYHRWKEFCSMYFNRNLFRCL
jgi:hypothetical protein